ncbi:transglutaminase-like domain-containing protein [Chitiniphilus shinanonensis]|uniref:transglutaminase-like domain-containing protein n=1 Tax=Chitiniphilus shinanonensis TaxID=553088 RepID=UPI00304EB3FB
MTDHPESPLRRAFLAGCCACLLPSARGAAATRLVRQQLILSNPGQTPLHDATALFYAPARLAAGQRLATLDIDQPHRLIEDRAGNTLVELPIRELAPFASRIVRVTARLEIPSTPAAPDLAPYLLASPFVEVDAPAIRALAASLRRASSRETVQAIHAWVNSHLQYAGFVAEDRGAAQALAQGRGDCTEFAYLCVALARACDIPARMVGGYLMETDGAVRSVTYHNWAEVWLAAQWQIVDAQRGPLFPAPLRYVAFRIQPLVEHPAMQGAHKFSASPGLRLVMH